MRRSWLIVLLLVSVGVNIGLLAAVAAWRARGPRPMERFLERRPPIERLADRLELEGESRERFLAEERRFFESFQELRRKLATTRGELRREVGSRSPDRARIDELVGASAGLTADLDRLFVEHVLSAREILGPERQDHYLMLLDRLREQDEGPPHRPPPGPPGRRP